MWIIGPSLKLISHTKLLVDGINRFHIFMECLPSADTAKHCRTRQIKIVLIKWHLKTANTSGTKMRYGKNNLTLDNTEGKNNISSFSD